MTTDARIQKSTQAILKAGLELFTQNKEAKLSDVAVKAGVGRATLYRLFKDRDDLALAIALDCINKFERATAPIEHEAKSAMHAMQLLFEYAMPLTLEFQFLVDLEYFTKLNQEIEAIEQQLDAEMLALIEQVLKEQKKCQLPASWLMNFVDGLFYTGWLQQTQHNTAPEKAAEYAFLCFKHAVS